MPELRLEAAAIDRTAKGQLVKLLYSSEAKGKVSAQLGTQHYSYRFVEVRFLAMFERQGLKATPIAAPEAIKHPIALNEFAGEDSPVHIAFRSSENFRPIPGIHNICHFAWEFPVLSADHRAHEPLTSSQVRMLQLADEVWVPSRYAEQVLRAHGLDNVVYMPTPVGRRGDNQRLPMGEALREIADVAAIPLQISTGLTTEQRGIATLEQINVLGNHPALDGEGGGKIFLLVCNPGDLRKNLLNSIDGFLMGAGSEDLLVVKLIVPNRDGFILHAPFDALGARLNGLACMRSPQVLLVTEYLSDRAMTALYSVADFYLSAPHMEGYNLPLLEAMAHGTVPVSNTNTAMADYINPLNAVLIAEESFPGLVKGMAGDVAGKIYDVPVSSRFDIARSVRAACHLAPCDWAAKAAAARSQVVRSHCDEVIAGMAMARLSRARAKELTQ